MPSDDERCAAAERFRRIDDAFRRGDLGALREAVDDPEVIPNGRISDAIGHALVYAIYHSPLTFIRELLESGADPNQPVDDGFPPLIAALGTTRSVPGAAQRKDVDDLVRLLLSHAADPNQRGAEGNLLAVQRLLDAGADPELRTRIDECETPLEMARAAGRADIAAMLERKGRPIRQRMRSGLILLVDVPGDGEPVQRQRRYRIRLRLWLNKGKAVRWPVVSGPMDTERLEDDGKTLLTDVWINRGALVSGLFYGVGGMRVGGTRRLEIAPHLAYGERGVPGVIPAHAVITAEVTILEKTAR
jgi:uncharacterized protein